MGSFLEIQAIADISFATVSIYSTKDFSKHQKANLRVPGGTEIRQFIVRIPELHAAIPEPTNLSFDPDNPTFDDLYVHMHDTFTMMDNTQATPQVGDLVECDFRNRKDFTEGIIVDVYHKPGSFMSGILEIGKSVVDSLLATFDTAPEISMSPAPPPTEQGQSTETTVSTQPAPSNKDWSGKSDANNWSQDKILESMHPVLRQKVKLIISRLKARGFPAYVFFGWRSSAVQKHLYDTNKSKVQFSFHNNETGPNAPASMGADIIHGHPRDFRSGKSLHWGNGKTEQIAKFWKALGEEAERVGGLTWGGKWPPSGKAAQQTLWKKYRIGWDPAHIELKGHGSLAQRKKANKSFAKKS